VVDTRMIDLLVGEIVKNLKRIPHHLVRSDSMISGRMSTGQASNRSS
jgi:hypothetical protein